VNTIARRRFGIETLRARLRVRAAAWARRRQGDDRLPTTISTRRVYILPTRAGFAFAFLVFVMLVAGLNYANSVALMITFVLAGFGLIAMHLCHRNLVGLTLRDIATVDAFAGEHGQLQLTLENTADTPRIGIEAASDSTERVTRDACIKASVTLIEGTKAAEHAALIEHLRLRGDLTASFIIRTIAHGKVDFFGSALVALSQQSEQRVRALLAGGHDVALQALFRSAGLAGATHAVIVRALKIWREVANGKRVAGVQEVSWLMLKELGGQSAEGDLAGLVKSIHLDALRENARGHALAIAAA